MRVGHVLRVDDEELFPADLLCLYSALPDNACFIKTTNLDGESNLKIRRPVDLHEAAPEEESDVMHIQVCALLQCLSHTSLLQCLLSTFYLWAPCSASSHACARTMSFGHAVGTGRCTVLAYWRGGVWNEPEIYWAPEQAKAM